MRRLWFLLFVASLALGLYLNHINRFYEVFRSICDLTDQHFYSDDDRLRSWVKRCDSAAAQESAFISTDRLMTDVQGVMSQMTVSHFQIYSPDEDRRMWKGESLDTGIRSRYVEDHLIVYRVLPHSSALSAGVRVGDDIIKIGGRDQLTPWGAQHHAGKFEFRRYGLAGTIEIELQARDLVEDSSPRVTPLPGNVGLVELASFRAEYFAREAWQQFAHGLAGYTRLILDLRENAGGNFVAMLRALSTFHCGGRNMGMLLQPRKQGPDKRAFDDDISDDYQMHELDTYRSIGLVTFADYGCYTGPVTVLVGPDTSSVAEIFANSFWSRQQSRVWGQPTAGDVLLAVWYDLLSLGPGFSVSIPEAVYMTPEMKQLEGKGVIPQRELYYDLEPSMRGQDSWVLKAL